MLGFILAIVLAVSSGVTGEESEDQKPRVFIRPVVADQLRDFPGVCFASTQCATYKPGESWDLKPYCGRSTCALTNDGRLIEVVQDCGPKPLENPKCKLDSEKSDPSAAFPHCCPQYQCEDGAELEYPQPPALPLAPTTERSEETKK